MVTKGHSKKKAGRKASKKKAAKASKSGASDAVDSGLSEPNPRSGQLASKGRARVARARTAEREQRRLHGAAAGLPVFPLPRRRPSPARQTPV